jgi:hypothetical protein
MAKRLNWQKAWFDKKLKLSLKDEQEFVDRDLASHWLERAEEWERNKQERLPARGQRRKSR